MTEHRIVVRLLADLVRVGAAVGALAALVGIPSTGLGTRFVLVLLVLLIPRAVGGVPAPLDLAFGTTLLTAAWVSTAGWYGPPVAWLVHAVAAGVTAVVLYLVLVEAGLSPGPTDRSAVARARVAGETAAIGVVVGGVWEAYRWLEPVTRSTLATRSATDLVVCLLVDVVGALVAGLVLAAVRRPADPGAGGDPVRTPVGAHRGSIL